MGTFSPWHLVIVLAVVLLLFGGKKIPELMSGLGKGIKSFKKAVNEEEEEKANIKEIEVVEVEAKEESKKPKKTSKNV